MTARIPLGRIANFRSVRRAVGALFCEHADRLLELPVDALRKFARLRPEDVVGHGAVHFHVFTAPEDKPAAEADSLASAQQLLNTP